MAHIIYSSVVIAIQQEIMTYHTLRPLLESGDFGLSGPGGADVNQHGNKIAFHANLVGDDAANRGM